MKSSHDPNLTSWALNELSPADRADYEEQLKKNPSLLAEAESTLNFCRFVQNHLRDERAALTESQRERLKSAARANSKHLQEEPEPPGRMSRPRSAQWWRRPAFVIPLSAAAAIVLGFLPFLTRKMAPDHSSAGTAPVISATATPRPELKRSVLSPTAAGEPAANHFARQVAAAQPVKSAADDGAASTSTAHAPLAIRVAQLGAGTSGAASIMKPGTDTPALGGNLSETGVALTNRVTTLEKIGSGSVLMLTGINTYTGGLAVNGGILRVGLSNAPIPSGYFGEPTATRGTMTLGAGRLNRTTSDSISELGDISDISEKANIMVNGGVSRSTGVPNRRSP